MGSRKKQGLAGSALLLPPSHHASMHCGAHVCLRPRPHSAASEQPPPQRAPTAVEELLLAQSQRQQVCFTAQQQQSVPPHRDCVRLAQLRSAVESLVRLRSFDDATAMALLRYVETAWQPHERQPAFALLASVLGELEPAPAAPASSADPVFAEARPRLRALLLAQLSAPPSPSRGERPVVVRLSQTEFDALWDSYLDNHAVVRHALLELTDPADRPDALEWAVSFAGECSPSPDTRRAAVSAAFDCATHVILSVSAARPAVVELLFYLVQQ